MDNISYILIISGITLIFFGLLLSIGSKFGFGSLPGDFKIESSNIKIYFPLASSIILSILLSLILYAMGKVFH